MFKNQQELIACQPPFWALSSHTHTIAAYLLKSPGLPPYDEKLNIDVAGGDQLVSLYYRGRRKISIYLFHGLSGDSQSSYMKRSCILAQSLGAHVYVTNHRGCGEGEGFASEPYHSGRSEDASAVIAIGKKRNPDHLHVAIGFSLSGNVVLLLAAGIRATALPDAVISVNPPIQLERAAKRLHKGLNLIYDQKFLSELKRAVKLRQEKKLIQKDFKFPRLLTTYGFDKIYTGEATGFGTRENYYSTCSSAQYLTEITIPTLILTSEDDPFVDVADFKTVKSSKSVDIQIQKYGGHLGYLSRKVLPVGGTRWLDYFLYEQILSLTKIVD